MATKRSKRGGKSGGPATRPEAATRPRLVVLLDGEALPEDAARELWTKFSAHMDEHRGDMTGFATQHGYASVSPEYRKGQAVLVIKRG